MNSIKQMEELKNMDAKNIKFEVNFLQDVHMNARKKLEGERRHAYVRVNGDNIN